MIMNEFKEKYINPFTDYGFKRLFGEEPNKDLLLDFLNELLKEQEGKITELSYLPNEKLPISLGDRRAIFDIYCTNEKGEQFIVEMQKAEQKFFKDRTIFYSTFPIQEQARNKDRFWNFELKSVYTIGILDFEFEESEPDKYRHDVKLTEQETKEVFYDKLTYIYLEMPKFTKAEKELETRFEKWMFVLKNLPKLDRIPVKLKEKIFLKLFETAEIAKLNPKEYKEYEASVNAYRDIFNIKNTYFEKGIEKGIEKEKIEIIKNGLKEGFSVEVLIKLTGLSEEEIKKLKDKKL
ncbi:MAG: Rpn family recombination-promoting nuclease/putative transposase [Bacteroidales bacterium]|nr:Rpn family recombination-promoting nuclease/putative transposase [Bacteroidales bacterium]